MTVSDLLSIIALLLAIFAFLSDFDREFIKIKISNVDLFILISAFLLINFLIYYDWWINKISFLDAFYYEEFPEAKTWAYIYSLLITLWILKKIFYSKFPSSKQNELVIFYKKLLLHKEYTKVFLLINKYNLNDVLDYFSNKETVLNTYIVNKILTNKYFILNTETLNTDLYIQVFNKIIQNDKAFNKYLIANYIDVQLNSEQSSLNIELYNYNELDEPDLIICNKLLSLEKFFISDLYSKSLSNDKLLKHKLLFNNLLSKTIISGVTYSNKYEELQLSFLHIILNNMDINGLLVDYFDNNIKIIKESYHRPTHYEKIYNLIILSLIEVYQKNRTHSAVDEVILKVIIYSISIDDLKEKGQLQKIRNTCYLGLLDKSNKELIQKINSIYINHFKDYRGDFKPSVIDIISNY